MLLGLTLINNTAYFRAVTAVWNYAMCTLITGERSYPSLYGVTSHELAHSWFQHVLAFNESKYAWMDEGFTSFLDALGEQVLKENGEAFDRSYEDYRRLVSFGLEEPLTTHADRFDTNFAYGTASYDKGSIFLTTARIYYWTRCFIKNPTELLQRFCFHTPNAQ